MKAYKYMLLLLLALSMGSCKKDKQVKANQSNNKLSDIIADNFNLSLFNTGLTAVSLRPKLAGTGPFTVLTPSDEAFAQGGYGSSEAVLSEAPARIASILNYHILNGEYELNKLPFLFNQELRSSNGGKLFVTHWVNGTDTVLTINGARVLSQNITASNGLIQVIDRMLEPYTFEQVTDAIASDKNLSLFYQALQRADMVSSLKGTGPYTIFAPGNAAMIEYGYPTLAAINTADPATLKTFLRYHILNDRRFVYDYVLSAGASNKTEQTMQDGNSVAITISSDAGQSGTIYSINLKGSGNTSAVQPIKQDVLTGNGVLHTLNGALKITQ
jgi:uncharacterized surface protein with fasciclin (FAS1) repeats